MPLAKPFSNTLLKAATALALALLLPFAALAQPDTQVTRLLFEAHPIPEDEAQALPLVSLKSLATRESSVTEQVLGMTSAERNGIEGDIADYMEAIGDQESEEGPYSTQLLEDLNAAGRLAQTIGEHDRALDFFSRAHYVSRINDGLENLEQVEIMQDMIESHLALGETGEADNIQEAILELNQRAHGERGIEVIPAMLDYGIWHMDAFLDRSNILLNIDRMNVVQFMNDPMNYMDQNKSLTETPLFNLYQAQQSFLQAISILIENRQYYHPRILDLEEMLLKTYFLSIHRENILYEPDFYLTRKKSKTGSRLNTNAMELLESEEYRLGVQSHQRSLAYIMNNPERDHRAMATAMLEAADWHLLFQRKVKASRDYEDIYNYYMENPALLAEVEDLLYPDFPVILPVYLPPPNSREKLDIAPDQEVSFFGYFDVSFRIDKYGKAKSIKFLGNSGDVTRNMEIRLSQYLQNVMFRPRFQDGEPYTDTLSLRYYVGI